MFAVSFQHGGNLCLQHPTTGNTVLHVSCLRGLDDIVSFILHFCRHAGPGLPFATVTDRDMFVNALDIHNRTALQLAAQKGNNHYNGITPFFLKKHVICHESIYTLGLKRGNISKIASILNMMKNLIHVCVIINTLRMMTFIFEF